MTFTETAQLIQTITEISATQDAGPESDAALRRATAALIGALRAEGRLQESPMHLALTRTVELHAEAAAARLRGRRVLVTGGSGCVGTRLRGLLAEFEPAALVNLDLVPHAEGPGEWLGCDIRDRAALEAAFAAARPEVVFHLASIREPGLAETVVREAVETNVFGTGHIIEACRRHGVLQAVYSSTGKCFSYVTGHVYTASKKLAEAQWAAAARAGGPTLFVMTRFTHVLENGIIARDIARGIEEGMVGLHGPSRHFNIQNLRQATHLLINALALAGGPAPGSFWSAVDLGWPVNTLELALHEITQSGRDVGVRFLGVPKGYDESFFRGQFDWSGEHEYHPLINALEAPTVFADSTGTMIGAHVPHCPKPALEAALDGLRARLGEAGADPEVKQALLDAVAQVAQAIFATIPSGRLLEILWWGAAPAWTTPAAAARFVTIMAMLADLVLHGLERQGMVPEPAQADMLRDIAATFAGIPGLGGRAGRLEAATQLLCAA